MAARIGVDIGGTFTDIVVYDSHSRVSYSTKTPSTPDGLEQGVINAVEILLDEGSIDGDAVSFFSHGTTVGTNAVLANELPPVGLITNEGFRDIIEIGDQTRPELFNLFTDKPPDVVPRHLRKEVPGRLDYAGTEVQPIDEERARAAIGDLVDAGVESIVVSMLYSYLNDAHERVVGGIIADEFEGVTYTLSSEVYPEIREYERTITTVLNEAVKVRIRDYIKDLERELEDLGIDVPLNIMHVGGGVLRADQAIRDAIRTVLSGPAAGAVATKHTSQTEGFANAIGMDMGGTSTDVNIISGGEVLRTIEGEINNLPLMTPMIDLNMVGAGAGSITWVDDGGALRIGPESAGADPGPICYDRGGTRPTLTDAMLLLGRINPDNFLGGDIELVVDPTRERFEEQIANPMNQSVEAAAQSVVNVWNARLTRQIRRVTVERGEDPSAYVLVAFGGAGPLHAVQLATTMDMEGVLIPIRPGVFSARGLLVSDIRVDESHSYRKSTLDYATLNGQFDELVDLVLMRFKEQHIAPDSVIIDRALDMRYKGQSYELTVSVPGGRHATIDSNDMDTIEHRFHDLHRQTYGHARPDEETELITVRASGIVPSPEFSEGRQSEEDVADPSIREVYFPETGFIPTDIFNRYALPTGASVEGPAIIEESSSMTVIPPGATCVVTAKGNLLIS